MTAAHCVLGAHASSLTVHMDGDSQHGARCVREIIPHPKADVAILKLVAGEALPDRFAGETSIYDWGIPVSAFGYPEDTGESGLEPTPRYFRGNIQRIFRYTSHLGYAYDAAELSFGAPAGLSGGPVAPDSDYAMVMGIVAENRTSTTYLSTITERITESSSHVERIHSVINYSIAVRLDSLESWLDSHVPYSGADA